MSNELLIISNSNKIGSKKYYQFKFTINIKKGNTNKPNKSGGDIIKHANQNQWLSR